MLLLGNIYTAKACPVNASFSVVDSGGVYHFYNYSSTGGSIKYLWDFGDSNYDDRFNTTHTYSSAGSVTVVLTVTDTLNNCQDTAIWNFSAKPLCWISASYGFTIKGKSVDFSSHGYYGPNIRYDWDYGDGTSSSNFYGGTSHFYSSNATYTSRLIATDTSKTNCADTLILDVIIGQCMVKADFLFRDSILLSGQFINVSSNATNYEWDFGDSTTTTEMHPFHIFNYHMDRDVRLVAYDTFLPNCSDTFYLNPVNLPCRVKAGFTTTRSKLDVLFQNASYAANEIYLDFGDGTDLNYPFWTWNHSYSAPGTYQVMIIASDTSHSNCSDTFRTVLIVDSCNVKASFTVNDSIGYQVFTNTSTNAQTSKWHFGDGSTSTLQNPVHRYSSDGFYAISLVVKDTVQKCADSAYVYKYVRNCYAYFEIRPDSTQTYSGVIYNLSSVRPGVTYKWYFGDGDSSSAYTPTHTYSGTGPYVLCLKMTDTFGCSDMFCDTIGFDSNGNLNQLTKAFSIRIVNPKGAVYTSLEDVETSEFFRIFPNPNNGLFTLETKKTGTYSVYDCTGRILQSGEVDESKVSLDLRGLNPGAYFIGLRASDGTQSFVKMVVRE